MGTTKRFEVLNHLPAYGPMYIPVTENGEQFYSEGFVVKFFKSNGNEWIANFKPGWTNCSFVKDYPNKNRIIVIANGMGYIMEPDIEKPIATFGVTIKNIIELPNNNLLISNDTAVQIVNPEGIVWTSPRISWDGIKDIELNGSIVSGKSYDPMNEVNQWIDFKINLETKQIQGGSYRQHYSDNGKSQARPWWKFWK